MKWGSITRLVEKTADPVCADETFPLIMLFSHIYFIGHTELLEKLIALYPYLLFFADILTYQMYTDSYRYSQCKIGDTRRWKLETCRRVMDVIDMWVCNYGPTLCVIDSFVATISHVCLDGFPYIFALDIPLTSLSSSLLNSVAKPET